jgi:hypothetical protein
MPKTSFNTLQRRRRLGLCALNEFPETGRQRFID